MFFLYFGAMHALLEYYELTGDEAVRDAIVGYADRGRGDIVDRGERSGPPNAIDRVWGPRSDACPILALAFAARHAPDPRPYRQALAERLKSNFRIAYQQVADDPRHWTGPTAPVIHFPIMLFWATVL